MRVARVIGRVTLGKKLDELAAGQLLLGEVLDASAMAGFEKHAGRVTAMPESLVVFDSLGAGLGQVIAISEGREAASPFYPKKVPVDAYCAAILDTVEWRAGA